MSLRDRTPIAGLRERISGLADVLRASFGLMSGIAMLAGVAFGFGLPELESLITYDPPVIDFAGRSEARGLLETAATVTVSVAGLTFSVTIVAFTLASSQLSPRVLRSFRRDRLSQITLALFLGTFVYSLSVLVRLGSSESSADPPNLSVSLALLLALAAFGMFARFIGHIVTMLQPGSVIDAISDDSSQTMEQIFPDGTAGEPADRVDAVRRARKAIEAGPVREIAAGSSGYLNIVAVEPIIAAAREAGVLVRQRLAVGSYALPGMPLADVWGEGADQETERDQLDACVRSAFELRRERGLAQDVAFPIRQLADIALKGFSPGINDPTTAQNALEAMASALIRYAHAERPPVVRVDEDEEPRFMAATPELSDLVRLGFQQTRSFAAPYPTVAAAMIEMLGEIRRAALDGDHDTEEIDRQIRLLREAAGNEATTSADERRVADASTRNYAPSWR